MSSTKINSLQDCYKHIADGHGLIRLGTGEDICTFLNEKLNLKDAKRISIDQIPSSPAKSITGSSLSKYDINISPEFHGLSSVRTQDIGWFLCDQLGLDFKQKMGRGFQARECLGVIQSHIESLEEN